MHQWAYDGFDLLATERDGALEQEYIHYRGIGIDRPWALIDHSGASPEEYYYHHDRLGSIAALTRLDTSVAQTYDYTAFGQATLGSPGAVDQPFQYTGREWDAAAGHYFYRARWMDQTSGRFLSQDPLGVHNNETNLYAYVESSPINATDALGLTRRDIQWIQRFLRHTPIPTRRQIVAAPILDTLGVNGMVPYAPYGPIIVDWQYLDRLTPQQEWDLFVLIIHETLHTYAAYEDTPEETLRQLYPESGPRPLDPLEMATEMLARAIAVHYWDDYQEFRYARSARQQQNSMSAFSRSVMCLGA